jgi:membrane-bound serine protease (ClpP class)
VILASTMSSDVALVTATAGFCLIYIELNRPGVILPGSLGLLLTLFGTAAFLGRALNPWALGLLAAAVVTLSLNLYRLLPKWLLAAATLALIAGFRFLLAPGGTAIHNATAVACGLLLGVLSAVLSRIALRARRAKAIH